MIKRIITLLVLISIAGFLFSLIILTPPFSELTDLSRTYVEKGPDEVGSQNIVTAVVVTYRGLDTLGEVAVLFIASAGVGFILVSRSRSKKKKRKSSPILKTGTSFLLPLILMFGVYVFVHGHLTPGGGFQGGVIIASVIALVLICCPDEKVNKVILHQIESLSGSIYIIAGLFGIFYAAGFLDNSFLPLGHYGSLFSAGAIPLIYSLIGLKVGSEFTGIVGNLRRSE